MAPFENSAEEALMMGSLALPAIESMLTVYKSKMPKKTSPEFKELINTPIRETFKKFVAELEAI